MKQLKQKLKYEPLMANKPEDESRLKLDTDDRSDKLDPESVKTSRKVDD